MMMLKNIIFEANDYFVLKENELYKVFEIGFTHSELDSSYDNESIAIARAIYLQEVKGGN